MPFDRTKNTQKTMQVVDGLLSCKKTGLSFRKARAGPEQELILWFLEQNVISIPRGHRLTVFREPRLPSGFPDLVIVLWKESIARQWTGNRAYLTAHDLRVMHFLAVEGPKNTEELTSIFQSSVSKTLERLTQASMIRATQKTWHAKPLASIFAATHIIAVEAKITEWKSALDQAHLNTWFASESCVLVPKIPRYSELLQGAHERGVTVLARDNARLSLKNPPKARPRSYVSWLFNEWAWLAAHSSGT